MGVAAWLAVLVSAGCCNDRAQTKRLKQQTFISYSFEGYKSQIKVLTDLVPGESPLPGLQMGAILLCLHTGERERERSGVSSYEDAIPITGAPPS